MKPEEINMAIAKACGWRDFADEVHPAITYKWGSYNGERAIVPDYLNDLNACHSMEETLDLDEQEQFVTLLGAYNHDSDAAWNSAHATAAERCEAFLKTIGHWKKKS